VWINPNAAASSNPISVGANQGVLINPFANATSVFCGAMVDTYQAIVGARLRLHCGFAGSTTTVDFSSTCVRGVIEALHSCSGLSRLDMEQCLITAVLRLDGDVCGLPTYTPYGPIRDTLCNALFHMDATTKSSVATFCIGGARTMVGGRCGWWKWLLCAAEMSAATALCCIPSCNLQCFYDNVPTPTCKECIRDWIPFP